MKLFTPFLAGIAGAALGATVFANAPAHAFTRAAAEYECNQRIRRGLVAPNQSAFNSCVRQQEAFNRAVGGETMRGFEDGAREEACDGTDAGAFAAAMLGIRC